MKRIKATIEFLYEPDDTISEDRLDAVKAEMEKILDIRNPITENDFTETVTTQVIIEEIKETP